MKISGISVNYKKYLLMVAIFTVSLVADIITKYLAVKHIRIGQRIDVIGSFFQLVLVYNEGGAFGIMQGYKSFFLIVSIIVLILLFGYFIIEKNKTLLFCISMSLIFSGAVGNIIDRLAGRPGVVDFIWIGVEGVYKWPAFNVADSAIVVGAFILMFVFYMQEKAIKNQKKEVSGDKSE